jgi:Mlc titration factor MtfA (ptsG expression regulator)
MLKTLLSRLGAASAVTIPDALWEQSLAALPFTSRLTDDERRRLRALAEQLLADKEMAAADGLELTAEMQVNVAVQACLPILNLGIDWYRGWTGIVIYPSEFLVPREITDESGVVHEYVEPITGEAWDGGPLLLSWEDARTGRDDPGPYNVVIHEFTHKIDMLNGEANGVPEFDRRLHPTLDPQHWSEVLHDAFERLHAELDLIDSELPPGIDPDDAAADHYYTRLPLDPYAAHSEGEFFAVSSEAFFVDPARLRDAFPDWYSLLSLFFRQDPLLGSLSSSPLTHAETGSARSKSGDDLTQGEM